MPFQRLKAWAKLEGLGVAEALSDLVDGHLVSPCRLAPRLRAGRRQVTLCDDGVGRLVERHRVRFQLVSASPEAT